MSSFRKALKSKQRDHKEQSQETFGTVREEEGLQTSCRKLAKQRELQYLRLSQRIGREKKMFVISQKIQTRKDLQDKVKKMKVHKQTISVPAVYRFEAKRKR